MNPSLRTRMLLAACVMTPAISAQAQAPAPEAEHVYLEPVRCVGGPFGLKLPTDLRQVRALGKLLREEAAPAEQWEGYTATRKTLYFDGLALGVVEVSNDPAWMMVTYAEVSGAQWNRLTPFKLGQPVAAARKLLGSAAEGDPALRKNYGGDGDSLQLQSAGGVVTRVTYQCYSG